MTVRKVGPLNARTKSIEKFGFIRNEKSLKHLNNLDLLDFIFDKFIQIENIPIPKPSKKLLELIQN